MHIQTFSFFFPFFVNLHKYHQGLSTINDKNNN